MDIILFDNFPDREAKQPYLHGLVDLSKGGTHHIKPTLLTLNGVY